MLIASVILISLRCVCGALHFGLTARQQTIRMKEYHPGWHNRGRSETISSATLMHLVETGHLMDPSQAFRGIYQM